MIVYGDPQFESSYLAIIDALSERVPHTDPNNIDDLRTLLVQTGQLEQAVCDLWQSSEERTTAACDLTEKAALTFYAGYSRMNSSLPERSECPKALLQSVAEQLRELGKFGDERLTLKVPEGFEFYALYPEQYCCAARDFLNALSKPANIGQSAVVVGIRSIGTSLSALLKIVLETRGWLVNRLTVRPNGHPYERQAHINLPPNASFHWGIVVDEGPGISGSSMAAVARALSKPGIKRIAFFPGHNGQPGPSASTEVRQIWKTTPRFFASLDRVTWNEASFRERLLSDSQEHCDRAGPLNDLSGGLWRKCAFANEQDWPAACIPFERMKFLADTKPGQRLLWKFHGFGALKQEILSGTPTSPFTVDPISNCLGFVATRWIEGKRLKPQDAKDPNVLVSICDYIVSCPSKPMQVEEKRRGIERVGEMLYWNAKEALGDRYADEARAAMSLVEDMPSYPTYSDGRMGPWEWVRDVARRNWKTDCTGHDSDHTIIGKQPLLWDIAGAIVEWELSPSTRENFLNLLRKKGIQIKSGHLRFFLLAYTAFRVGQCSLCATVCGADSAEHSRLQSAFEEYRSRLKLQFDNAE